MKKFFVLNFLLIAGVVFSLDYLKIDEIKPGMKGYGLSVFRGWEPEKFDVEIIDVIKNTSPGRSYILARLKGQNLEHSGVIAGMSGSPVYIDGKIVGAVAYTWSFSKDPICGITPLENMLAEEKNLGKFKTDKSDSLKKISTPVFINGFSGFAKNYLINFLKTKDLFSSSMFLESTKIGGDDTNVIKSLKAGDAVAINLVEGDLNIQGVGTVTYVRSNDVFIFGHPMDEAGKLSLPISRAYIFTIIPSSYLSFKIGASSQPIGSTIYDGQNAVYCKIGEMASMIPFEVNLKANGVEKTYNFKVADNENYFPSLATSSIIASILNHTGFSEEKRMRLSFSIEFVSDNKNYIVSNQILYSYYPSLYNFYSLANDLNSFFSIFYYNDIANLRLKKCKFEINLLPDINYYFLESAGIRQINYNAGENINIKITLRKYKGDFINRNISLKLPEDIKNGQYSIIVGSESAVLGEIRRAFPYYYSINSVEELEYWANYKTDDTKIVCALIVAKQGKVLNGKKLVNLPEVYGEIFQSTQDKVFFPDIYKKEEKFDAAVFGISRINITIGQIKSEQKE